MFELRDAIELAFIDLEESFTCNWRSGKGSKESIIEAFSQREVSPYIYLGYEGSDGLRHAFARAIPDNNKPTKSKKKWEDWVLERINLYYCNICSKVHDLTTDPACKNVLKNRSTSREATSKELCEYLAKHPCELCGETDIRVLEFDHLDPEIKSYNIADRSNRLWNTVLKEIEKCRVLCANCHKRYTSIAQNHFKHRFFNDYLVPAMPADTANQQLTH